MARRLPVLSDFAHIKTRVPPNHSKQICNFYKRVRRAIQSYVDDGTDDWNIQEEQHFEYVAMRKRFDDNKDIKDMRIAKKLLQDGEAKLINYIQPEPMIFANSPGGITYHRYPKYPDWLADYWDPIEKAQYPSYFRKREMWKKQRIDLWEAKYGKIKDPWADV